MAKNYSKFVLALALIIFVTGICFIVIGLLNKLQYAEILIWVVMAVILGYAIIFARHLSKHN